VFATVGIVLLAACGGGDDVAGAVVPAVQRNADVWALPLDGYEHPLRDSEQDRAYALVWQPCLAARGFDLGVPPPPARYSYQGVTFNRAMRKLFTEELAAELGYRGPADPTQEPTSEARAALDTPAGKQANDECDEVARAKVPLPPDIVPAGFNNQIRGLVFGTELVLDGGATAGWNLMRRMAR
jgi:hypothetical protein